MGIFDFILSRNKDSEHQTYLNQKDTNQKKINGDKTKNYTPNESITGFLIFYSDDNFENAAKVCSKLTIQTLMEGKYNFKSDICRMVKESDQNILNSNNFVSLKLSNIFPDINYSKFERRNVLFNDKEYFCVLLIE